METSIHNRATSGYDGMLLPAPKVDRNTKLRAKTGLISIVEDDSPVLKSMARLVRSAGYRVLTFGSAEEFLQFGKTEEVGCVILDIKLPGMSGLDLQTRLAAEGCQMPIVFVTAHNEPETRTRALDGGAVAFLGKPVSDDALLEAIRSGLERK